MFFKYDSTASLIIRLPANACEIIFFLSIVQKSHVDFMEVLFVRLGINDDIIATVFFNLLIHFLMIKNCEAPKTFCEVFDPTVDLCLRKYVRDFAAIKTYRVDVEMFAFKTLILELRSKRFR